MIFADKKRSAFLQLVGGTPTVELSGLREALGLEGRVYAKLENRNAAGSVKDRIVISMLDDAKRRGYLRSGSEVVEATSGNTGIALAAYAAAEGYSATIVMPDTMSVERRKLVTAYGAKLVLTDGAQGMKGAVQKAAEIADGGAYLLGQFENPANPMAHFATTGPELYASMRGQVDVFVAGVGTGGTISGVGRYLKQRISNVKCIAVEPSEAPVLSSGRGGLHIIQGIGAGFVPKTLDMGVVDDVMTVSGDEAKDMQKLIASAEGLFVGLSAAANAAAAVKLAKDRRIRAATVFPDGGEKYLSMM